MRKILSKTTVIGKVTLIDHFDHKDGPCYEVELKPDRIDKTIVFRFRHNGLADGMGANRFYDAIEDGDIN